MSSINKKYNAMPEFIFGMAVDLMGEPDEREYLFHFRYPRFICRIQENWTPLAKVKSKIYAKGDLTFSDFIFLDKSDYPPSEDLMDKVLEEATEFWKIYNND